MTQETPRKKPGPTPKGFKRVNAFLPPEMIEWAKNRPEGLSALLRRLLTQERQRLESNPC